MNEIQLKLEISEVNQILTVLGQLPYTDVFQLIQKIQQQAAPQIETAEPPAPSVPTASAGREE